MFQCLHCDRQFETLKKLGGHKSIHNEGGRYKVSRSKLIFKKCAHITCDNLTKTKYCSSNCQHSNQWNSLIREIESGIEKPDHLMKKYLLYKNGNKCELCDTSDIWNNKPLTLQLDHIDGNSDNNKLNNLRILCPNCHTQTDTWCVRNIKNTNRNMYSRMRYKKFTGD